MNQDKIWDVYQNDKNLQFMGCRDGGRIDFFSKLIPPSVSILNIGVGLGRLEKLLCEKGVDVHSLDPSEASIANLQHKLGLGEKAKVGYSQDIPFPEDYFDYVIMTEVIEHLSDGVLKETIAEVNRVLKPGGRFEGSVPADEDLTEGVVICPHCGERFHRWGHLQSFSKFSLHQVIATNFREVSVKRVFFLDLKSLNWKGKLRASLRWLQVTMGLTGSNQNFYFSAKKDYK
ncbi:class I SAM-dependent methyltransferase [Marinobacteraceae bacterium S3BR75-40.1]